MAATAPLTRQDRDADLDELQLRADAYGVSLVPGDVTDKVLRRGERVVLRRPTRTLATRDLDTLTRWVGVPDAVFAEPHAEVLRAWLTHTRDDRLLSCAPAELEALPGAMYRLLFDYVHGDSRRVAPLRASLERWFGRFDVPLFSFRRVVVPAGAVLELEATCPAVLLAHTIELATTARIVARCSLNVDCVQLRHVD